MCNCINYCGECGHGRGGYRGGASGQSVCCIAAVLCVLGGAACCCGGLLPRGGSCSNDCRGEWRGCNSYCG